MPAACPPSWLERAVQFCLRADPQDTRLGDLSEQYVRGVERGLGKRGAAHAYVGAGLQYAASAAMVVVFDRVVDPGLRLVEDGTVGLMVREAREKVMNAMRRLAMPAVLLACSAFLVFSAVGVWQDWRQSEATLRAQQRGMAEALAQRVNSFVGDASRQIGWVTFAHWSKLPVEQQRFDLIRMMRQTPAVSELTFLDEEGRVQLDVSRLRMDVIGSGEDRSADPAFVDARRNRTYFGPVHFIGDSKPHLKMAISHGGPRSGVTVAALNLMTVWNAVAEARIGETGYAYIVDRQGRLVAHADKALVLRGTDMKDLAQVAAAFAPDGLAGTNRDGAAVWAAQSPVKSLDWRVFVELPVAETRMAFWMAMGRAAGLLALGLAAAWFAFRIGMRPAPPLQVASV